MPLTWVTCAQLQALLCQLSWLLMATAKIKDICDNQWTLFTNLVNSHAWWVGHDDASSDVIPTDSSWLLPSSPTPSSPSSSSQTSSGDSKHVGISGLRQIWNIAVPETSLPSSSYPRQTSFDEEIHLHCCHPGLWVWVGHYKGGERLGWWFTRGEPFVLELVGMNRAGIMLLLRVLLEWDDWYIKRIKNML